MGSYDAAVKVILSHCRQAALEYFLGLEVVESEVMEVPQETASLWRSDFPIRVRTPEGRLFLVLLEVQSRWENDMRESVADEMIKKEGYNASKNSESCCHRLRWKGGEEWAISFVSLRSTGFRLPSAL